MFTEQSKMSGEESQGGIEIPDDPSSDLAASAEAVVVANPFSAAATPGERRPPTARSFTFWLPAQTTGAKITVPMSTSGQPYKNKPRLEGEEEGEWEENEEPSASTSTSASNPQHKIILDVPGVQCVECRLCEESFQGHNELRHIRLVHKLVPEMQYRCLGCGKTGDKVKAIKACARKHGIDPNAPGAADTFTCGECGRLCASAKGLEGHRRTAHVRLFVPADADPVEDEDGANEQDGIECVECGKRFPTERGLGSHLSQKHNRTPADLKRSRTERGKGDLGQRGKENVNPKEEPFREGFSEEE